MFRRVVGEVGSHVGREAGGARQRTNRQGEARVSIDEDEGGDIQDENLGKIRQGVIGREFARRKANVLVTGCWGQVPEGRLVVPNQVALGQLVVLDNEARNRWVGKIGEKHGELRDKQRWRRMHVIRIGGQSRFRKSRRDQDC